MQNWSFFQVDADLIASCALGKSIHEKAPQEIKDIIRGWV
jgi:hypothetical protein|tara:strand:- start:756 stop:875 length:120 start_codon:yes stop_codon:yes gene_type:complete